MKTKQNWSGADWFLVLMGLTLLVVAALGMMIAGVQQIEAQRAEIVQDLSYSLGPDTGLGQLILLTTVAQNGGIRLETDCNLHIGQFGAGTSPEDMSLDCTVYGIEIAGGDRA